MNDVKNYMEKNFELENLNFRSDANHDNIQNYFNNAKADAIHYYQFIKKYLHKNKKIKVTISLKLEKLITFLLPAFFCPYLIMKIKKKFKILLY